MPRKTIQRKRYTRYKKFYRRYKPYQTMAKQAFRLATKVASIVNAEEKVYDRDESETPSNTGTILVVNNPAEGETDTTRVGDSLKMKSLILRGQIYRNASATTTTTQVRVMIFIWKQPVTAPTISDILESGFDYVIAPKSHDHRFMSKVLYDRVFEVNAGLGLGTHFKHYVRFAGRLARYSHVQYNNNTQNINNNGLYVLMVSNETTNTPTVDFISRVTYYDN